MFTDNIHVQQPVVNAILLEETKRIGFTMASDVLTGAMLRTLVASKPEGMLLELGTGTGVGTAWMLDGMDTRANLITVDVNAQSTAIAQRHLGHDTRLTFMLIDAKEFLKKQKQKSFDLIFADTWTGKFEQLDETLKLLKLGGLYIIDDLLPQENWPPQHQEKVDALVEMLEQRNDLTLSKLIWSTGVIIATRIA